MLADPKAHVFNLFVDDPDRVDGRQMRYRMKLTTEELPKIPFPCSSSEIPAKAITHSMRSQSR